MKERKKSQGEERPEMDDFDLGELGATLDQSSSAGSSPSYYRDAEDVRHDIRRIREAVAALSHILSKAITLLDDDSKHIDLIFSGASPESDFVSLKDSKDAIVQAVDALNHKLWLEVSLNEHQGPAGRKWPFSRKEVNLYIAQLCNYKEAIDFAVEHGRKPGD